MFSKGIRKEFIAVITILAVLLIGGAATVASAITVSGIARDWSGNVIPAPGVTVTLVGDESKTTTSSTADGTFSLSGVPANTAFSLKFSRADYLDVYSPNISASTDINLNVSSTGSAPFNMPTAADLTAFGAMPDAGKGLIAGRVADATYRYSATVGGAFLTAAGGSKSYPVFYRDSFGNLYQGGTTSGNGRFYVLNVDGSDTVILSTSKPGWLFNPLTFGTHADGVSMGRIYGAAPGYVTMSGSVLNIAGAGIAGARLELKGDGGKFTDSAGGGSYSFGNLPKDANFYIKTTAAGYAPHYASANLPGNLSGIIITPWTAAEMAGVGVTGSNGLITCRVTDMSLNPISGATVTLQSKSGTVYTPGYPGGSGATSAAGTFLVPNILPDDVVKVSVTKAGYAFGSVSLDGFAGAVTGRIIAGSTPVAYNSYISDKDTVGIPGATVEQAEASPANSTTSSPSPAGAFTLNVPYGVPFYLRFSKTGFADTYTAEMTRTAPVNESISDGFTLQAATRLTDWNVASGKGIIRTRVKDSAGTNIGGAVVLSASSQGRTYTVCYDDDCTPGLTTTQGSSGRYIVRDVEPGDTVTVTAQKSGYTFNTRVFHIYAGSVHQGGITGTAVINNVSGTISYGGSQTGNFKLMLWSADMMGNYYQELSLTGGSFSFNNVPNGRYFLSAYRDRDNNSQYTAGEAYGYYQDANGLKAITVNGAGANIGAVTLADPSSAPTGASVSINAAIGGVRGYLIFFRSGDALTSNLQNGTQPSFSLAVDLTAGSHTYPVTQMQHDYTGMPVPAGNYDFYFMTGDLDRGPDKGIIQYVQTGIAITKGAVTAIPASGSIPFNIGGAVSGNVTSSFGAHHPLGRVLVYLTGDLAGQVLKAWGSTNADGQFQFDHVSAGTYYLQLVYAGYNVFSPIAVTVTDGGTTIIPGTGTVLTPTQTPATISGTLTPFGPGVDSRILLKQGDAIIANVAPATTDGSYAISDVVPGSYTLIGSARGYMPAQVSVGVTTAGQALTQSFNLNGTKNVIVNGLNWLLAHQRADGSFDDNQSGNADTLVFGWTGYTGLTLLAVLENPKYKDSSSPDYLGTALLGQIHDALYGVTGATPKNGIQQYFEGTYHAADDTSTGWNDIGAFYNSTISWSSVAATPVALEKLIALGMPLNDPKITGAVQFLLGAQITAARASNPIFAGGWRYNPGNTDTDNWETAWVIMALMKAGVNPTVQAVVDGVAHIRRSQITEGGGAGLFAYQPNDTSGYGPLGTSAACILALNFAGAPNTDPGVDRFFQWVKNNGGFNGYDRWADAYWWSMFPWAAILYDDPTTSAPVKKYYETLELTWNMADDVISRQNTDGSWSNPNYIPGGSNSGNAVMYTASALMAIAPYAGLTPLPDETTVSGTVRNPSGQGLQYAKVEALLDGVVRASTVANGSGVYTLNVPQNYAYVLRVTVAGYVRKTIATANVGTGGLTGQDIAYLTSEVDAAAPTIANPTPTNGSTVVEVRPVISVGLADLGSGGNAPSGIDPATIAMKLDGNGVNASYDASTGVVSFAPQKDLPYATHTVTIDVRDFAGNAAAQASWSFTNSPGISFTGYVADSQSPSQIIAGATIEQGGVPTNSAATDATGLYILGNLQPGLPFYLKIYGDASYAPCYSAEMTYTANRVEPRDRAFTLFPAVRLGPGTGNWNVDADKGIIRAYVRDRIDDYIGGAVVTATGVLQPTYAVCYDDDCTPSLTATKDGNGAGRYVIKNVLDGDTVTVTATKAGWTFNTRVYHTFAGGVSQGRLTGQGPVSLGVTVITGAPAWSPIQGVQTQVVGFPDVSSTTGTNGNTTLTGLPPDITIPFTVGKAGYVNGYGMFSASAGVSSWRVPLFTQTDLTTWGIQAGSGVVYGRLIDNANSDSNTNSLAGVQVQCASAQGRHYDVVYLNDDMTVAPGATATLGNGRYLILNVASGDTLTVSARKAGWSFWSYTVRCYADGVSYRYIYGIAGGATVTMYVNDKNNAAISGATVRVAENTTFTTTSDDSGKATLTNLPLDTVLTFEVTQPGYHHTYSRHVVLTGNSNNWGTYFLYALDDAVSLGGIPADRGVITGWVKNEADGGNLAGARVTCTSTRGNSYTVAYLNNDGTIATAAAATSSNGRFIILNVEPEDTVAATATLAGWTFDPRTYTARISAVNQSSIYGAGTLKGDLDGNRMVNLADAIIAVKIISGLTPAIRGDYVTSGADVNNDGKIGSAELIFILQRLAETR